jgi:hypothetical protein
MEFLHDGAALGLMEEQPLTRRQLPLSGDRVVVINDGERFQHVLALVGKPPRLIDELPSAVGQAVGKNRLQLARQIPGERIGHLDWWRQFRGTPEQHILQVLPGVLASAEE